MNRLVQTHQITPEDEQFFQRIAEDTRSFWGGALSRDLTEADFDAQEMPEADRPVAKMGCRNMSVISGVSDRLQSFCSTKGFDRNTNAIVYSPMSFMRWHTNSNSPGIRHYFTYTGERAVFRWKHPETGEVFDEIDNIGWTYRVFAISNERPLWHTIWTQNVRLSFGFSSINNSGTINGAY
jgi:hypothetical protein